MNLKHPVDWRGVSVILIFMETLFWEAPEFEHHERGISWYYLIGGVGVILVTLSLWQNNFLFAIFVALAVILLFVWGKIEPATRRFSITDRAIQIDNLKTMTWSELKSFSIREPHPDEHLGILVLDIKRALRPDVHIPLPSEKIEAVRTALQRRLPEREHNDSLIDEVLKFLHF